MIRIMISRAIIVLLPFLALGVGCVERKLSIRSEPPGAEVRVDEVAVGKTPCEIPFVHYGAREVVIEMDGHRSIKEIVPVNVPWYQYFPFDFISETLIPLTIVDERRFDFTLEKSSLDADREGVIRRAKELRERASQKP